MNNKATDNLHHAIELKAPDVPEEKSIRTEGSLKYEQLSVVQHNLLENLFDTSNPFYRDSERGVTKLTRKLHQIPSINKKYSNSYYYKNSCFY